MMFRPSSWAIRPNSYLSGHVIDLFFFIFLILAVVQGWRKGLILGLFSLVCGLIGLAAAVKLSSVVAAHMKTGMHLTGRWLPVWAFLIVFVLVMLLVKWLGHLLEGLIKLVLLGWLNKLAGIGLFIILYLSVYSVILFYGAKTGFINKQTIQDSHCYSMIAPLGPSIIRFISGFIPFGQDMFTELEGFFDKIAHDIH
jgi:membrane protein required for colicin V production